MKIALCDNDQECVEDIEKHLNQYFSAHTFEFELFKFSNSTDILNSDKNFDIAILAVEIDDINGIEIGRKLQKTKSDTVLIFVTNMTVTLMKRLIWALFAFSANRLKATDFTGVLIVQSQK